MSEGVVEPTAAEAPTTTTTTSERRKKVHKWKIRNCECGTISSSIHRFWLKVLRTMVTPRDTSRIVVSGCSRQRVEMASQFLGGALLLVALLLRYFNKATPKAFLLCSQSAGFLCARLLPRYNFSAWRNINKIYSPTGRATTFLFIELNQNDVCESKVSSISRKHENERRKNFPFCASSKS